MLTQLVIRVLTIGICSQSGKVPSIIVGRHFLEIFRSASKTTNSPLGSGVMEATNSRHRVLWESPYELSGQPEPIRAIGNAASIEAIVSGSATLGKIATTTRVVEVGLALCATRNTDELGGVTAGTVVRKAVGSRNVRPIIVWAIRWAATRGSIKEADFDGRRCLEEDS